MMDAIDFYNQNYVPYSNRPSLSVVKSKKNRYFPGVRIENISYPLSISSIQNALCCCLSESDRPAELLTTEDEDPLVPFWKNEFGISVQKIDADNLPAYDFTGIHLEPDIDPRAVLVTLLDQAVVEESNFPVSALIETEQGYFSGVNIECSAWNMGLCAERIAIAKALTFGSKKLKKLYIHSRKGEFSSPCGACRQVILEHLPDKQIHLYHADQSESIHFGNDLLPHSFRSSSLAKK